MFIVTKILAGLVAASHLYIMHFEMFRWTTPKALKMFNMTAEVAAQSKILAGNQGLYNGFLAAGLIWSLLAPPELATPLVRFFSGCVLLAGLYGGATATPRIYLVQALPGALTLAASFFG
jgi:putative membrane protein